MEKKKTKISIKKEQLNIDESIIVLEDRVDLGHILDYRPQKGDIESLSPRQKAMLDKINNKLKDSNKKG